MKQVFEYITNNLINNPGITALIPLENIFPIVASAGVKGDFLVYTISRTETFTKDGLTNYTGVVSVYCGDALEVLEKANAIELYLTNLTAVWGTGVSVGYAADYNRAFVEINLVIKYKDVIPIIPLPSNLSVQYGGKGTKDYYFEMPGGVYVEGDVYEIQIAEDLDFTLLTHEFKNVVEIPKNVVGSEVTSYYRVRLNRGGYYSDYCEPVLISDVIY